MRRRVGMKDKQLFPTFVMIVHVEVILNLSLCHVMMKFLLKNQKYEDNNMELSFDHNWFSCFCLFFPSPFLPALRDRWRAKEYQEF